MRNVIGIITVGLILVCYSFGQTTPELTKADFSGTWTLDKTKTKNLPAELEEYVLKVAETAERIEIKTEVKGDLQMRRGGGGNNGGSGGGRGEGGPPSFNGRMALGSYVTVVVYTLDDKEAISDIKQGDVVVGKTKFKAKLKKDGKVLDASINRELQRNEQKVTISTHEKWELADDGKTLKISRDVSLPMGSDSINLVFIKQN
ncbi:MAG TPA: hypothetical protein PKY82_00195 [Pyrinomonadaceae bacterium]|nr:hypothetical protein [Pyrinomonadaceae bacterium]